MRGLHTLYGDGGVVGPDLTGGDRRHDFDSLLAKSVDPGSELPATSRFTIVTLRDGRIVGGVVENRTGTTLTLRTTADPITLLIAEIPSTEMSTMSLMPLLESLTPEQRRNLVAYLMPPHSAASCLPDGLHRILANRLVGRDQMQFVLDRLTDEHPVERIAMDRGQLGQMLHRCIVQRQRGNLMSVTLPGQVRPCGRRQREAAQLLLHDRFPERNDTEPHIVLGRPDEPAGGVRQPIIARDEPQEH